MKIKDILGGIFSQSAYFQDVLHKKTLLQRYVKPKSTKQEPSTEAILARDPSKDEEHYNRPIVDATIYGPDGEVFVNERQVDPYQAILYSDLRRKGHYNQLGQAALGGSTPEMKALAIEAYIAKGGVFLTPAEKQAIHRYYEVMKFPDMVPSKDDSEVIRKFHEIVDKAGILDKVVADE